MVAVVAPGPADRRREGAAALRSSATRIWLVLERGEPSVWTSHHGFGGVVTVTTEPDVLMRVSSGIVSLREARVSGRSRCQDNPGRSARSPASASTSPTSARPSACPMSAGHGTAVKLVP